MIEVLNEAAFVNFGRRVPCLCIGLLLHIVNVE